MRDTPRRLPFAVIALGLTSLFTDIGTEMVFPLLPAFLVGLGAGPTFLGLIEGVAEATAASLKFVSGLWVDRLPRTKPLVLFGYGLSSLVRPLVALAVAPWHVLAVRVTDRVGKGLRSSPRDVLIAASVDPAQAGRAFGLHQAMDHAGAVVGPLLATALLAAHVPMRTIFFLAAIPGALAVGSVLLVKEVPRAPREPGVGPPVKLPNELKWLLGIFLVFALSNSSDAFLLLRAKELGVTDPWLPVLWCLLNLSKALWSALGGAWSDRVPRHRLVLAGWGLYALSYTGFGLASTPWHVWALFVVYGAFYGVTEPVEKALIKDLAPQAVHGRAFGVYNAMFGLAAIPSGLLTGTLWQQFGATVALGASAAVALVSAVLLATWVKVWGRA